MLHLDIKLFEKYLSLKNLSEKTKHEYLLYALRFQTLGGFNNESISYFLLNPSNQNNVARSFISILKKYLIYNRKELQLTEEEFKEMVEAESPQITGRKKERINVPFTKEEMRLIEETLESEELKLMFLVCYNGGLRLSELVNIKLSSINWNIFKANPEELGEIRVIGKGNKERITFYPSWLMTRIKEYIHAGAISHKFKEGEESKLFSLSARVFEIKLQEVGLKTGITRKNERGEVIQNTRVHPHKLRHQLGYDLAKAGYDINYIKKILGHTSITSTQIYTQLNNEDIKEKMKERNKVIREVI
jgi:integrase/recombinase XerD